jgi:predicted lipoprotein with Yx(FWY)xxD motif
MGKRLLATILTLAAIAVAHEEHNAKLTSISGMVIDTGCYMSHDSKGDAHAKCAAACAKNGVPLAILDEKGTLYMPIAVEHKDQNAKLAPFIEKKVKVTGTLMEKGGLKGIAIKTVEPAQ